MYLSHLPVNHHLRPLYRALAGLAGLYLLVFGVVGLVRSAGLDPFAQEDLPKILGQQVNPAQSVLDIVLGAAVVVSVVLGRNIDHYVNFWVGHVLYVVGIAMLSLLRTDANFLGYNVTNVIVTLILATVIVCGGLYGRVGPQRRPEAEPAPHAQPART
jgi:hypothetical protein